MRSLKVLSRILTNETKYAKFIQFQVMRIFGYVFVLMRQCLSVLAFLISSTENN